MFHNKKSGKDTGWTASKFFKLTIALDYFLLFLLNALSAHSDLDCRAIPYMWMVENFSTIWQNFVNYSTEPAWMKSRYRLISTITANGIRSHKRYGRNTNKEDSHVTYSKKRCYSGIIWEKPSRYVHKSTVLDYNLSNCSMVGWLVGWILSSFNQNSTGIIQWNKVLVYGWVNYFRVCIGHIWCGYVYCFAHEHYHTRTSFWSICRFEWTANLFAKKLP